MANQETNETSIGSLVRLLESNYVSGTTTVSKHVVKSMKDDLDTIDAYINSRFTSGSTDSQGREKPFFNIVTAARNIWYRATDVNRKDLKITARKIKQTIVALLATAKLQEFMDRAYFGQFLNKWGLTLATYGSAVLKFVVKDGELHSNVVPWNRLIVDPISFDGNPVIEVLELTEGQLRNRGYDADVVEELCSAVSTRKTIEGTERDNLSDYIKVYEVHGELPLSYITGNTDDSDTYVQQMHVCSFVAGSEKDKYDDYTLYSGREENPYMITHLIEEEGQTLSIGSVQNLFEAQWMENHTMKAIKDQLDLASLLIFQTADGNYVGKNALTALQNGDILVHAQGQPLTTIANTSHDITALTNQGLSWKQLGNEINGISEAMMGINPPSHTAWRQTQAVLQESYSLFDLMKQSKKLYLEEMLRKFIIPFIKRYKLNTNEEVVATLELSDINKIDSSFIKNQTAKVVNHIVVKSTLDFLQGKGPAPTPQDQAALTANVASGIKDNLSQTGNKRFFAPDEIDWKTELKDLEWDVELDIEGENEDSEEALSTLNTMLMVIAKNPLILQDPNASMIFNKILLRTGTVSPAEIKDTSTPSPLLAQPSPIQPQTIPAQPAG